MLHERQYGFEFKLSFEELVAVEERFGIVEFVAGAVPLLQLRLARGFPVNLRQGGSDVAVLLGELEHDHGRRRQADKNFRLQRRISFFVSVDLLVRVLLRDLFPNPLVVREIAVMRPMST